MVFADGSAWPHAATCRLALGSPDALRLDMGAIGEGKVVDGAHCDGLLLRFALEEGYGSGCNDARVGRCLEGESVAKTR